MTSCDAHDAGVDTLDHDHPHAESGASGTRAGEMPRATRATPTASGAHDRNRIRVACARAGRRRRSLCLLRLSGCGHGTSIRAYVQLDRKRRATDSRPQPVWSCKQSRSLDAVPFAHVEQLGPIGSAEDVLHASANSGLWIEPGWAAWLRHVAEWMPTERARNRDQRPGGGGDGELFVDHEDQLVPV